MRISERAALTLLVGCLSACGSTSDGEPVSCRTGRETDFAETCSLVWQGPHDFVIRNRDGGFHRFVVAGTSEEIRAADGAETLKIDKREKGLLSLTIGDTVYHIRERQLQR